MPASTSPVRLFDPALVLADVPGLRIEVRGSSPDSSAEALARISAAFGDVFSSLPADVQERLRGLAATYARLTVFAIPASDRRSDRIVVGKPQVRSRTSSALFRVDGDPWRQAALAYAHVFLYGRRGCKLPDRLADQSWPLDSPAAAALATAWGF